MRLSAHQPTYLPWLGLFNKIASVDRFIILDTVQYERRSFENRNYIKTANGPLLLSVPVESNDHFNKTGGQIKIVPGPWSHKHVRSIEQAYAKAYYFRACSPDVLQIIEDPHETLCELNVALLECLLYELGIRTPIEMASAHDFRGQGSGLIIDMCRKMGATEYLFGKLGQNYAEIAAFERAGIRPLFQDYQHPTYTQLHGEVFVPNMSVIDLLFNHGPDSLEIINATPAP